MNAHDKSSTTKVQYHSILQQLAFVRRQLAWWLVLGLMLIVFTSLSHLPIFAQLSLLTSYIIFISGWVAWRLLRVRRRWRQKQKVDAINE